MERKWQMGAWCDIPLNRPSKEVGYTDDVKVILVQCSMEFSRHITKPLAEGAEADFVGVFERTVGNALQNGALWSPINRAWVLRFSGKIGKEADRLASECGESLITGQQIAEAAMSVIERAQAIEARITA
jgi:hypothetical protein